MMTQRNDSLKIGVFYGLEVNHIHNILGFFFLFFFAVYSVNCSLTHFILLSVFVGAFPFSGSNMAYGDTIIGMLLSCFKEIAN